MSTPHAHSGPWARWRQLHAAFAAMLLNVLVLLVLVNVALGIAYAVRDARREATGTVAVKATVDARRGFDASGAPLPGPMRTRYQLDWFDLAAYGGFDAAGEATTVLDDFYALAQSGFVYQPWVQFAEPVFDGTRVHVDVDARGFSHRRTLRPGHDGGPAVVRVFALGGSTTFGYNVADEHTWPSFLAMALDGRLREAGVQARVEVTNWGRGYFYPTQEVAMLVDLLRAGYRPDVVAFMDGVNLGPASDVPHFTSEVATGFREAQFAPPRGELDAFDRLPMVRFARSWSVRATEKRSGSASRVARDPEQLAERFSASWMHARLLCRAYGLHCAFFLQPDPVLNYPIALYRRAVPPGFVEERREREAFYARLGPAKGVVDLTGLFATFGTGRKAILDDVHYTPAFNRFVADAVARSIGDEVVSRARSPTADARATGAPRGTDVGGHGVPTAGAPDARRGGRGP